MLAYSEHIMLFRKIMISVCKHRSDLLDYNILPSDILIDICKKYILPGNGHQLFGCQEICYLNIYPILLVNDFRRN